MPFQDDRRIAPLEHVVRQVARVRAIHKDGFEAAAWPPLFQCICFGVTPCSRAAQPQRPICELMHVRAHVALAGRHRLLLIVIRTLVPRAAAIGYVCSRSCRCPYGHQYLKLARQ